MRITAAPQFWWRTAIVVLGAAGLLIGNSRLIFFTFQSNVLVLVYFSGVLYWTVRRGTAATPAPRLRGLVTLAILGTGLIAHVILNHGANPLPGLVDHDPAERVENQAEFLLHYVVPIMTLTDWIVFGPHRVVKWREMPLWILYPLGYGIVVEARAAIFPAAADRYPYFFLDVTRHGWAYVLGQFVELAVIFGVLGAVLLGLDRLAVDRRIQLAQRPSGATPGLPDDLGGDGDRGLLGRAGAEVETDRSA
jgi:hypothetical protein